MGTGHGLTSPKGFCESPQDARIVPANVSTAHQSNDLGRTTSGVPDDGTDDVSMAGRRSLKLYPGLNA